MSTATLDISSIGFLAGKLLRSPNEITRAEQTLGIVPAVKLNGVTHYDAQQVELLSTYFRERKGSKR